jgi:hypothetical protein
MPTVSMSWTRRRSARRRRRSLSGRFLGVNPVLKGRLKRNLESAQGRDLRLASVRATGQPVRVCQGVRQRRHGSHPSAKWSLAACLGERLKSAAQTLNPSGPRPQPDWKAWNLDGKRSNGEPRGELRGDQGHKTWLIDRGSDQSQSEQPHGSHRRGLEELIRIRLSVCIVGTLGTVLPQFKRAPWWAADDGSSRSSARTWCGSDPILHAIFVIAAAARMLPYFVRSTWDGYDTRYRNTCNGKRCLWGHRFLYGSSAYRGQVELKVIGGLSPTIDRRCDWRPIRAFLRWPCPRVPSQCYIQHCFSPSPPLPFHAQIATASRATNFDRPKKLG